MLGQTHIWIQIRSIPSFVLGNLMKKRVVLPIPMRKRNFNLEGSYILKLIDAFSYIHKESLSSSI